MIKSMLVAAAFMIPSMAMAGNTSVGNLVDDCTLLLSPAACAAISLPPPPPPPPQ